MPNAWIGIESGRERIEHLSKNERPAYPILFHHSLTALYLNCSSSVLKEGLHDLVHLGEEYVHGVVSILDLGYNDQVRAAVAVAVEEGIDVGRSFRIGGAEEVVVGDLNVVRPNHWPCLVA
jgi:hypothetical protein